jgi:RNA polymerase sigma-70 factor (ECF subfamily)
MLGNRSEAEDVLQEVFVTVWTKAESYQAALGSPLGWLVGITRNRGIDRLRANSVRARTLEMATDDFRTFESPELSAARNEKKLTVHQALAALPSGQRELIEHAYFLGLTHSELAERFTLPLGTVKTRVRTGLTTLREQLARHAG